MLRFKDVDEEPGVTSCVCLVGLSGGVTLTAETGPDSNSDAIQRIVAFCIEKVRDDGSDGEKQLAQSYINILGLSLEKVLG